METKVLQTTQSKQQQDSFTAQSFVGCRNQLHVSKSSLWDELRGQYFQRNYLQGCACTVHTCFIGVNVQQGHIMITLLPKAFFWGGGRYTAELSSISINQAQFEPTQCPWLLLPPQFNCPHSRSRTRFVTETACADSHALCYLLGSVSYQAVNEHRCFRHVRELSSHNWLRFRGEKGEFYCKFTEKAFSIYVDSKALQLLSHLCSPLIKHCV